jgi:hypothetical protein
MPIKTSWVDEWSYAVPRLVVASRLVGPAAHLGQRRAVPWAHDVGHDETCDAWAARAATAVCLRDRAGPRGR